MQMKIKKSQQAPIYNNPYNTVGNTENNLVVPSAQSHAGRYKY